MDITLNNQQIELLQTLLEPLVKDNEKSNYTRTVALAILTKLKDDIHNK